MALAFAPTGRTLTVVKITAEDNVKRRLESMGLGVGSALTALSESGGDIILRVKSGRVALNRAIAMKILVA